MHLMIIVHFKILINNVHFRLMITAVSAILAFLAQRTHRFIIHTDLRWGGRF